LLIAQESEADLFKSEKKNQRFEAGVPVISPFIMPAYTPEMKFIVAGGGLMTFKTKRNNPYLPHSTLPVTFGISTNASFFATAFLTTYWRDDKIRFYIDLWYRNMDDHYWGIGVDNGFNVEKGTETTQYHRKGYRFSPSLLFKIANQIYAGLKANVNHTVASDISSLMKEDQHITLYGTDIFNVGAGATLIYDARDFPPNPSSGLVVKLEGLYFNKSLGSDNNYEIIEFDYRHYLQIIRDGSILAWQIKARIGFEHVPWIDMSTIGSFYDLRGYFHGQFRDRSMSFILIEYRHTFFHIGSIKPSRHGMVFWIGGGTVFSTPQEIKKLLPGIGLGYRYELQPRMNLRVDIGFGTETMGLYLGFNEAF
jgi:outer membrane protein assembly factor BamA